VASARSINEHTHHAGRTPPALPTNAEDSAAAAAAAGTGPNLQLTTTQRYLWSLSASLP